MRARLALYGALSTLMIGGSAAAHAQQPSSFTYSVTPVYRSSGDLGGGGEADYQGLAASFTNTWPLDQPSSVALRLGVAYEDWSFDGLGGFGGVTPWDDVMRVGLSVSYTHVAANGWIWNVRPTVEYTGESGASVSDSLEYGTSLSVAQRLRPDLVLGLGLGVYERIEDSRVFPFVFIDWRITERTRMSNPSATGPAGPAGIELSHALDSGWTLGAGGAYQSRRHRLDDGGPFDGGVGAHRFIPVYVRLGRSFSESVGMSLYVGAETDSQLRVYDANGRRLHEERLESGFMAGLAITGRF
jgi:hypothetical protein